jgi:hypothetical protein
MRTPTIEIGPQHLLPSTQLKRQSIDVPFAMVEHFDRIACALDICFVNNLLSADEFKCARARLTRKIKAVIKSGIQIKRRRSEVDPEAGSGPV